MTKLLTYLESQLAQTPLELLARVASELAVEKATARPEMATSVVWKEIIDLSHDFHSGLVDLFFDQNKALRELTIHYGLF